MPVSEQVPPKPAGCNLARGDAVREFTLKAAAAREQAAEVLSRAPGAGQTSTMHPNKSGQTAFRYPEERHLRSKTFPET